MPLGFNEHFFFPFRAHLWAFDTSTLGPLTEDLTPAAGTELAAGAVPHVSMVTHCALVLAASLSSSAFITALPGTLHFGLPLFGGRIMLFTDDERMQTEQREKTTEIQGAYKNAGFVHLCFSRER